MVVEGETLLLFAIKYLSASGRYIPRQRFKRPRSHSECPKGLQSFNDIGQGTGRNSAAMGFMLEHLSVMFAGGNSLYSGAQSIAVKVVSNPEMGYPINTHICTS